MKYREIDKQVQQLEQQIADIQNRKTEAEARISDTKQAVDKATEDLKKALVKDDKKQATMLQNKIRKMENDIIRSDELLIQGINEELKTLQQPLEEARQKRDKLFADNAAKVLETEKAQHSKLAKQLLESTRRLLCVHQLLRDRGYGQVYRETVGPGYDVLPLVKIPILEKFDRVQFTGSAQVHPGNDVIREMEAKITA
ncbi:MAG: hypothetical protein ACLFUL_14625 [Desulfobacteraceae bacterium]